jgi:hypothetical protein
LQAFPTSADPHLGDGTTKNTNRHEQIYILVQEGPIPSLPLRHGCFKNLSILLQDFMAGTVGVNEAMRPMPQPRLKILKN